MLYLEFRVDYMVHALGDFRLAEFLPGYSHIYVMSIWCDLDLCASIMISLVGG